MKTFVLAGMAALLSTAALAQSPETFLNRDLRDRGSAYIAADRAHEDFAVARERAETGNYLGAAVAQERGEIQRERADHDIGAAHRNGELYRLTR